MHMSGMRQINGNQRQTQDKSKIRQVEQHFLTAMALIAGTGRNVVSPKLGMAR
jgi:hypothetical protein